MICRLDPGLITLKARLYIDPGEAIRFRVDSVEWQDVRPMPPVEAHVANGMANGDGVHEEIPEKDPIERAGYKILVSFSENLFFMVEFSSLRIGNDCGIRFRNHVLVELRRGRSGRGRVARMQTHQG